MRMSNSTLLALLWWMCASVGVYCLIYLLCTHLAVGTTWDRQHNMRDALIYWHSKNELLNAVMFIVLWPLNRISACFYYDSCFLTGKDIRLPDPLGITFVFYNDVQRYWKLLRILAITGPCLAVLRVVRNLLHSRVRPGFCACGYDLTGNITGRCPECGRNNCMVKSY